MAIWHFRFSLIPREAVITYYGNIPFAIPDHDIETHEFWNSAQVPSDLELMFRRFGPEISSWSKEMRCWGEAEGHQISILYSNGNVEWVTGKLDARVNCTDFLHQLIATANQLDCLLLAGETYVLEPKLSSILEHFRTSVAFRYLSDPEGTLKSLPKGDRS